MSQLNVDTIKKADGTGNLTIPATTGTVLTTAGGVLTGDLTLENNGLYLGGTGSANKLDDYEEGTWVPTVVGSSSAGTATYAEQHGTYVKVGSLVHLNFKVYISGHTGSGNYRISSLPFANGSSAAACVGSLMLYQFDIDNTAVMVSAFCSENNSFIELYETLDNANWRAYEISNSLDYLFGSITLKVDV